MWECSGESLASRVNPWFSFLAFIMPKDSVLQQSGKEFKKIKETKRMPKIQLKGRNYTEVRPTEVIK